LLLKLARLPVPPLGHNRKKRGKIIVPGACFFVNATEVLAPPKPFPDGQFPTGHTEP